MAQTSQTNPTYRLSNVTRSCDIKNSVPLKIQNISKITISLICLSNHKTSEVSINHKTSEITRKTVSKHVRQRSGGSAQAPDTEKQEKQEIQEKSMKKQEKPIFK